MVRLHDGGFRKINFKDYCQEAPGAANDGALWEALTVADWSIGLGAGSLPSTYQGEGYRHLITSSGLYSRKYTVAPGANDWWHTVQNKTLPRYMCSYDFGFRVNTAFAPNSVVFGYFIQHGGSPLFTETEGYRLRLDGTALFVEKITALVPVWTVIHTELLDLDPDKDYYVRIVYIPEDFTFWKKDFPLAGYHLITIDERLDERGQGKVLTTYCIDAVSPLTGGANTTMMVGAVGIGMDAEFWGIIYSNGFLWKGAYAHYKADMDTMRQDCVMAYHLLSQEPFTQLVEGDRVECWFKERYQYRDPGTGVKTNRIKTYCRFDGQVYKIQNDERNGKVWVYALDELSASLWAREEAHDIPASDTTYYDHIQGIFPEFQGSTAYPRRVTRYCGWNQTDWSVNITANWTSRGNMFMTMKLLAAITGCWLYWDPVTAMVVSQRAPIITGKKIILSGSLPGENARTLAIVPIQDKRDNYLTKIIQYHDDGLGGVTSTAVEDTTDRDLYGDSTETSIAIDVPPVEGALMANNKFDQQNDNSPVYDTIHLLWGIDIGIGCQIEIVDSARDVDSDEQTVTQVEVIYADNFNERGLPHCMCRIRSAVQAEVEAAYPRLPKIIQDKADYRKGKRKESDYSDFNWT
jgi:hypothetical protein